MLSDLPEDILVQISCAFYLFDSDKDGMLKSKDFLKIKGYKRTLECLIKEERYKNIENRNLKVIK